MLQFGRIDDLAPFTALLHELADSIEQTGYAVFRHQQHGARDLPKRRRNRFQRFEQIGIGGILLESDLDLVQIIL